MNMLKKLLPLLLAVGFFLVAPHFAKAYLYPASDVLGQTDALGNPSFTGSDYDNGSSTMNSIGMSTPVDGALDTLHHRLFITEYRGIMVYMLDENNDVKSRAADYIIGQTDFALASRGISGSTFADYLGQLAYDPIHNYLFVSDQNNYRVLVFDVSVISNGMSATYVLGAPDMNTTDGTTSATGMGGPYGLAYDKIRNRLFVSDQWDGRIMVFNLNSLANNIPASYFLGQPNATSSSYGLAGPNKMDNPSALAYDDVNDRLFVADHYNSRVLVFNTAPGTIANNMNASFFLGQSTSTAKSTGLAINRLNSPNGLAYDSANQRLFVSDTYNSRIMIFNVATSTIATGMNASNVLEQPNFTTRTTSNTATQTQTYQPNGILYDSTNNRLYHIDNIGNRVLVFQLPTPDSSTLPSAMMGQSYFQSISVSGGTSPVTCSLASGNLPAGLSLNADCTITGTSTATITASFAVKTVDNSVTAPATEGLWGIKQMTVTSQVPASIPTEVAGTSTSTTQITLSWASSGNPEGAQYYAENLTASTNSGWITSTSWSSSGLVCGTVYGFRVKAKVDSNESGYATTTMSTSACPTAPPSTPVTVPATGFALPAEAYEHPALPLSIQINNGAKTAVSRTVSLSLEAGKNTARMAISNTPDFNNIGQEPFIKTRQWDLCAAAPNCDSGLHTVYIKYYTRWGQTSDTLSASISLLPTGHTSPVSFLEHPVDAIQEDSHAFSRFLKLGSKGQDVLALQQFLNNHGYLIAKSGAGSPGRETQLFGQLTSKALAKFQNSHKKELGIAKANGIMDQPTMLLINFLKDK